MVTGVAMKRFWLAIDIGTSCVVDQPGVTSASKSGDHAFFIFPVTFVMAMRPILNSLKFLIMAID